MDQLRKLLSQLTLRQKLSIVVAAVLLAAGMWLLIRWSKERDFRPLFTNLSSEDAGAVVAKLRELNAEYRVTEGGSSVLVPSAQVADLRIQLAAAGLPKTGRIGFELFDRTNFGITDFAEQVNFHRAIEGELERSVMSLAAVEKARVHVTFPKESVFLEARRPAKASVMIKLRPGSELTPAQVQAICHLTASAVDGLRPEDVSVLDMNGNLLSRPRKPLLLDGVEAPEGLLEYQQNVEKALLAKVHETLEPLWGPGRFRAGVSVECDFTSGEQSEETFDPENSVMTSSQRTEDISGGRLAAGTPGTASNLPRPTARPSAGTAGVTRRSENITYQTSRVVRHLKLPVGTIRRISVSVLLDHQLRWEGSGRNLRKVLTPPSGEQIQSVRELVAAATGLKPDRGDQIVIESLPFESTLNAPAPLDSGQPDGSGGRGGPLPLWLSQALQKTPLPALIGVGVGVLLAILALVVLLTLQSRKRKAAVALQSPAELPPGVSAQAIDRGAQTVADLEQRLEAKLAENKALNERQEMLLLDSLKLPDVNTKKVEVLRKHIMEETQKDSRAMAQIVRTWLNETGG